VLICTAAITFTALAISLPLAFSEASSADNNPGRIAFFIGPDLYSMKPDGSDVKQLTSLGSQNIVGAYQSWSFDGKQIVFVEIPPNGPLSSG